MLRKVFTLASVLSIILINSAEAKIWRVNNNPGISADFTTFNAAATSATVNAGDTLYMEPSAFVYQTNSLTLSKKLIVIGPGYFIDPTNATYPINPGLQAATKVTSIAFFRIGPGADGSKFIGVCLDGSLYFNGASNITFEKVFFGGSSVYFENGTNNNVSVRKCFTHGGFTNSGDPALVISNIVFENNIFDGGYVSLDKATGTGNIYRNNSSSGVGNTNTLVNFYVANNIFGLYANVNFLNSTIKNNLFSNNQPLPGTATNNQVNVNMANVYVSGTTGSIDSRYALKPGSPAIGAGLSVGAVVNPDCGAYGATDPYKLSGIPDVPAIYSLTVPTSIPSGSSTMNVTFSTRNNN